MRVGGGSVFSLGVGDVEQHAVADVDGDGDGEDGADALGLTRVGGANFAAKLPNSDDEVAERRVKALTDSGWMAGDGNRCHARTDVARRPSFGGSKSGLTRRSRATHRHKVDATCWRQWRRRPLTAMRTIIVTHCNLNVVRTRGGWQARWGGTRDAGNEETPSQFCRRVCAARRRCWTFAVHAKYAPCCNLKGEGLARLMLLRGCALGPCTRGGGEKRPLHSNK
jgi:hypothetical protein